MCRASSSDVIARSTPPSAISGRRPTCRASPWRADGPPRRRRRRRGPCHRSTTMSVSSASGGSSVSNWLATMSAPMKWPVRWSARSRAVAASRCEEHEAHVTGVAEQIAVPAGQRRAGDDDVVRAAQLLADAGQPGPAVVVGQRMTRRHLGDVGRRVQRVGVDEHGADGVGDRLADRGLARPGDAHDDDSTVRAHGVGRSIGSQPTSASSAGHAHRRAVASQASMFITADMVDPELVEPYIDIDELRTTVTGDRRRSGRRVRPRPEPRPGPRHRDVVNGTFARPGRPVDRSELYASE